MGVKERVAEIMLDSKIVDVDIINPFKYASGIISPIYTDCRLLISLPEARRKIINYLVTYIEEKNLNADILVGAGVEGIPLTAYLSEELDLPTIFVRETAKGHGKKRQVEGEYQKGQKALIVTDIISTEKVSSESVDALRAEGLEVIGCVSIFDNCLEETSAALEKKGVKYHPLTDLKTTISVALIKNAISDEELTEIKNWMSDPYKWHETRLKEVKETLEKNKRKTAEILLDIGAISLNVKEPFRYVSGILSPIYTDNRLLISRKPQWNEVIKNVMYLLKEKIGLRNIDVLAGVASAGIPHAAKISDKLDIPMVYVKKSAEDYGKKTPVGGSINRGSNVVVIDDLISTGGSLVNAVEAVRDHGGVVNNCVAIFTYNMPQSKEALAKHKVEVYSVTDINTVIDVAVQKGKLKADEKQAVLEWMKDTKGWGKKMGFE